MKPHACIIRTAGTNCDRELAYAFEMAGASTETVHLNALIDRPDMINRVDLIGFPGGFSYGDDIAAGRILANRLRHQLLKPLQNAVKRHVPIIGICNGFQVLIKLGLLPNPVQACQVATLADNTCGRFIDRWVPLQVDPQSSCIWTTELDHFELPIAHGEGRFTAPENILDEFEQMGQIAIRYADSQSNPNGSQREIAGISDPSGLILGLMPHPERYTAPTHHPQWTRHEAEQLAQTPVGLRFFQNAVEYARIQHQSQPHSRTAPVCD